LLVLSPAQVTCKLPAGGTLNSDVLLTQNKGKVASHAVQLSYTQCASGTRASASSVVCTPCGPGEYSSTDSQLACTPCDGGFFVAGSGNTGCGSCGAGTYSVRLGGVGPRNCTQCPVGFYSPSAAQSTCQEWCAQSSNHCFNRRFRSSAHPALLRVCHCSPVGTFNNRTGQTECTRCAVGKHASGTGP
jgi:hypothetical protein